MGGVARFDVYLVPLDPSQGRELNKTRPCVVISPNEFNDVIPTVLIAPMTTGNHQYPSRVAVEFRGKKSKVVIDQIRVVDKSRLYKKLGQLEPVAQQDLLDRLAAYFAP